MSRVLLVGDLHLSDRPPRSCADTYTDDLFELLDQCSRLARDEGCDAIVQAGDVFHRKQPNRTSHRLIQRVLDWARAAPCPVYVVPGNHDLRNDRVASLDSQPLGVLFRSGLVLPLDGWGDDTLPDCYGVPWQQDWTGELGIGVYEAFESWLVALAGPALLVTHAPIYPPGRENPWECVSAVTFAQWAGGCGDGSHPDLLDGAGDVYYGHVHERHGVFTAGGMTFANMGALSRGSLHEYDLTRTLSGCLWDGDAPDGRRFTEIPFDARPVGAVLKTEEAREVGERSDRFDAFIAGLRATTLDLTSPESVLEEIRAMDLGDHRVEIEELVSELLEGT